MLTLSGRISDSLVTSLVSGPVFAAEWNETDQTLTVHTCAKAARRHDAGSDTRIAIKTHSRRALQSPRSLEALAFTGADTKIVYDPTQIFTRAAILVQVARSARAKLPGQIAGCYFHAASRTLQIVPHSSVEAAGYNALKRAVAAVLSETDAKAELGGIAVRVASELPRVGECLAVDNLSVRPARYLRGVLRTAIVAAFSTGMLAGAAAHAGTPANHGLLGGLSVFADGIASTSADGFVSTGMAFFFGEEGASSQIELQLAQGNSNPGLRIVVNPERQVEDGPELRRPVWNPYTTNGAGPGGGQAGSGNTASAGPSS